jgi:hypothetical protein
MTSRDFCYWLQGLFELSEPVTLNEKQTDLIKRHLALVFIHEIDPSMSDDPEVQQKLQDIHDGVEELKTRKPKPGPRGPRGPSGGRETRYMC